MFEFLFGTVPLECAHSSARADEDMHLRLHMGEGYRILHVYGYVWLNFKNISYV